MVDVGLDAIVTPNGIRDGPRAIMPPLPVNAGFAATSRRVHLGPPPWTRLTAFGEEGHLCAGATGVSRSLHARRSTPFA